MRWWPRRQDFQDHHRFTDHELRRLLQRAEAMDAVLVTTAKDAVRLPPAIRARVAVADVTLEWADETALMALLALALMPKCCTAAFSGR